jgi:hypothetical protein
MSMLTMLTRVSKCRPCGWLPSSLHSSSFLCLRSASKVTSDVAWVDSTCGWIMGRSNTHTYIYIYIHTHKITHRNTHTHLNHGRHRVVVRISPVVIGIRICLRSAMNEQIAQKAQPNSFTMTSFPSASKWGRLLARFKTDGVMR